MATPGSDRHDALSGEESAEGAARLLYQWRMESRPLSPCPRFSGGKSRRIAEMRIPYLT